MSSNTEHDQFYDSCTEGGTHDPVAAGDARDGGVVHCFKCQRQIANPPRTRPGQAES